MLTHVDEKTQMPTMVDIMQKTHTVRVAQAQSFIQLPRSMASYFNGKELILKKGPVFQTAIIAGTMAVKKTADTIPFCHQIPIESCKFDISVDEKFLIKILCTVKTTFKTGVEMEALHGATVAALTVYDMCKAISHDMQILETRLIYKTGGQRTVLEGETYGLVLTGGKSLRMKRDKALIEYHGVPHAKFIRDHLKKYCHEVYLSAQPGQWSGTALENYPTLPDDQPDLGPLGGILAAFTKHPNANWFIVACDLAKFNQQTIETLLENYNPTKAAVAYRHREKDFAEPLCALYTPKAQPIFNNALSKNILCPVQILKLADVQILDQPDGINLLNVNTTEEFLEHQHGLN